MPVVLTNRVASWRDLRASIPSIPRALFLSRGLCYIVATKGQTDMLNTTIRARIDQETKRAASAVLAEIGLTPSSAFRLMMIRIARDKALPFQPLIPNEETIAAMQSESVHLGTLSDLIEDLNADD
jgi:DNA-damage-inducible protein J